MVSGIHGTGISKKKIYLPDKLLPIYLKLLFIMSKLFLQALRPPLKAFGQRNSMSHIDAKYPAMLFKQQLTASLEKIFGLIRDNLKKEISPLLSLCIQVSIFLANIFFSKVIDGICTFNLFIFKTKFNCCMTLIK